MKVLRPRLRFDTSVITKKKKISTSIQCTHELKTSEDFKNRINYAADGTFRAVCPIFTTTSPNNSLPGITNRTRPRKKPDRHNQWERGSVPMGRVRDPGVIYVGFTFALLSVDGF